jgi:hypothetical protein
MGRDPGRARSGDGGIRPRLDQEPQALDPEGYANLRKNPTLIAMAKGWTLEGFEGAGTAFCV